jgi:hypothetical protein
LNNLIYKSFFTLCLCRFHESPSSLISAYTRRRVWEPSRFVDQP